MAVELKSSLEGTAEVQSDKIYLVDFSKMQSVNDLILVLSALGISIKGDHPFINELKPFLNLEKPIVIPNE